MLLGPSSAVANDNAMTLESGVLNAHVALAGSGGAAPPPNLPTPSPFLLGAYAQARVQVWDIGQPLAPVVEQVADDQGDTTFTLPEGAYRIVVAWSDSIPSQPGAPVVVVLAPDGTPVLAWTDVTMSDGQDAQVTLTVTAVLP